MGHYSDIYAQTLKDARRDERAKLNSLERCYNACNNKDSDYAKAVKGILDLRTATMKIWDDAPEAI